MAAWEEWHYYINHAKDSIRGPAILLDIHAHIHPEGNIELGYLISGSKLDNNDLDPNISSIRHLASRTSLTFEELLRGRSSLGYFLSEEGYSTVPSVSNPGPNGAPYWYAGTPGTNTAVSISTFLMEHSIGMCATKNTDGLLGYTFFLCEFSLTSKNCNNSIPEVCSIR